MAISYFSPGGYTISAVSLLLPLIIIGMSLAPVLLSRNLASKPRLTASFIILCFSVFIFYFRLAVVQNYELNPDESDWISNANTLLVDSRYMVSTVMPLLITAPLLLIKLVAGNIDFYSIKIFGVFTWITSFILLWGGLRNIFKSGLEFFVLLPLVIFVALMSHWDFVAYNSEHSPTLLFSLAVFVYGLTQRSNTYKYAYPILGFVLSSFLLSKIQMAPVAFVFALTIAINLAYQKKSKTLFLFCLSGVLPIVVVLAFVYLNGAMDIYLATHKAALGYVSSGVTGEHMSWPEKIHGFHNITTSIHDLHLFFGCYALSIITVTSLVVFDIKTIAPRIRYLFIAQSIASLYILGPALALVVESLIYLAFCIYFIKQFDVGFRRLLAVLGTSIALMLTSFYVIMAPPTNFSHYYILMIAPVSFYGAVVLLSGIHSLNSNTTHISIKGLTIIFIISALLIFQFFGLYAARHTDIYLGTPSYINRADDAAITQEIRKWTNAGDRITVWGWSNKYYALSQAAQATRITFSFPQFLKGDADIYWLNLFLEDMKKNNPIVFIDAIAPSQFMYEYFKNHNFENHPRVKEYIEKHYSKTSTISGVRIYVKNARLNEHHIPYHAAPQSNR